MSDLLGFEPTNTFNSVSFDVLRMDGVEDPLIDVNKLATMDINECYFESAVKFIIERSKEFADSKIKLYHSISEATSYGVIHESFSDFFDKIKDIIKKFLDFLKSLFQRFITSLAKFIDSESYLKKHKKDFQNFKPDDKFEFDGFKYTFSESIPDPDAILSFSEEFLGNMFEKDPGDILIVTYAYLRMAVNRFFDYKKVKNDIDKQYKKVEKAYKDLENQIKEISKGKDITYANLLERLPDNSYTGLNYVNDKNNNVPIDKSTDVKINSDILYSLDNYVKVKVEEVQECSNIHALAFSAKLDALKECNKQDRNTLYLALARIQRTQPKRERDAFKI